MATFVGVSVCLQYSSRAPVLTRACSLLFLSSFTSGEETAAEVTEEETEADLVLTELFTLGVEDVVSDSEDDHSDHALTASTAAAEVTRVRNENGQDSAQDPTQQAGASSSGMQTTGGF